MFINKVQSPKITPDQNRNESETRRPTARMHRDEKVTRVTKVGSDFPTTNDPWRSSTETVDTNSQWTISYFHLSVEVTKYQYKDHCFLRNMKVLGLPCLHNGRKSEGKSQNLLLVPSHNKVTLSKFLREAVMSKWWISFTQKYYKTYSLTKYTPYLFKNKQTRSDYATKL